MKFPPTDFFFPFLAQESQYNTFKDIYKVKPKGKKGQNKNAIEKEIFSKFTGVETADEFRDVLEKNFNEQRLLILESVGPRGRSPEYETSQELYSTLWERLDKLMTEKGIVRSRPKKDDDIIDEFIKNPQNYSDFYDFIKKKVGNNPSSKEQNIRNLKNRVIGKDRVGILLETMRKNYSSEVPKSAVQFYDDDFRFFDYVLLEFEISGVPVAAKSPEGWEKTPKTAEGSVIFSKILKIDDAKITNRQERTKLIDSLRQKILEMRQKEKKIGEDETMFVSLPKYGQGRERVAVNYSLMYEILIKNDRTLSTKKTKLVPELETKLVLTNLTDNEKIRAYFDAIDERTGVVTKILLFDIDGEPTVSYFFNATKQSTRFPPHLSIEKILIEGFSKAITDLNADKVITEKNYLVARQRDVGEKTGEELTKLKEERFSKLKGVKFYDKKLLKKLFNGLRTNRINTGKQNLLKYADYIESDGRINLNNEIFDGDFKSISVKLVPDATKNLFATTNKTLQNKIEKDLEKLFDMYEIREDEFLSDTESIIFDTLDNTVKARSDVRDSDSAIGEESVGKSPFSKSEEKALYDLVLSVEEGELLQLNRRDIKHEDIQLGNLFEYGVILSQDLLGKDYNTEADQLEELRKKDKTTKNEELVSKIKDLAAQVDKDLDELKNEFISELDRKLKDIVDSRGKYKSLYNTDAGQKLIQIMVRKKLLNREQ